MPSYKQRKKVQRKLEASNLTISDNFWSFQWLYAPRIPVRFVSQPSMTQATTAENTTPTIKSIFFKKKLSSVPLKLESENSRKVMRILDYSVVAGVEVDGFGGERKGAWGAFVGEVNGSEVVHDFGELLRVLDRHHRAGTIVLRHRSDVRPLRPVPQRHALRLLFPFARSRLHPPLLPTHHSTRSYH